MPALLSDAYGNIFAKEMQNTGLLVAGSKTKKPPSSLGAVAGSSVAVNSVVHAKPLWTERNGNYEIHITIDRHDCHLLCLFIGVFTLSVLFNSNKRGTSLPTTS